MPPLQRSVLVERLSSRYNRDRLTAMSEKPTISAEEKAAAMVQQDLLEDCLKLVLETFEQAVVEKVEDPVVFLLDCEDEIAAEIASSWLGPNAVRDAVMEQRLEVPDGQATTVYTHAFSWAECQREVPTVFDYLAPVFESPAPSDGFLAIAVTAGGASAFTVPTSARDTENS